jgi:ribosomal protein L6P/L9E
MVVGVTEGFTKSLELVVGYRASIKDKIRFSS